MTAQEAELDDLAEQLGMAGIAAFCPTTLSAPLPDLLKSVERLGRWMRSQESAAGKALPLGIHLEGPFIHPEACGAHPPGAIQVFRMKTLEKLWEASQGTLKILTVAPDRLKPTEILALARWCREKKVHLSAGHTRVTQAEATQAFDLGFRGVTHAWNAMGFHHRDPGLLGAAVGRKEVWIEQIIDQIHVDPTVIHWMTQLHSNGLCFVSDCAPAAAARAGKWCGFGPNLQVRAKDGACYTKKGHLAGGGILLPQTYLNWLDFELKNHSVNYTELLRRSLPWVTEQPLKALRVSISAKDLPVQLEWDLARPRFRARF